jgi:hypothetical protein
MNKQTIFEGRDQFFNVLRGPSNGFLAILKTTYIVARTMNQIGIKCSDIEPTGNYEGRKEIQYPCAAPAELFFIERGCLSKTEI